MKRSDTSAPCPRCGGLLSEQDLTFDAQYGVIADVVLCTGPSGDDHDQGCGFGDYIEAD